MSKDTLNLNNNDDNSTFSLNSQRKPGGLYKNIKMSVKTADKLIVVGILILAALVIFAVSHAGFTVEFNTDGGSQIVNQKVMYGQTIDLAEIPVKEGYEFTGWYTDSACTKKWNAKSDTVNESMTLYSGWIKK